MRGKLHNSSPFGKNQSMRPRVVILGAGFGGLWATEALAGMPVDVTLIDKNNYHTFLPLLYQVAAAELEPERIAQPVRSIIRDNRNIVFLLAEVSGIDAATASVNLADGRRVPYDFLIVALGSTSAYFGVEGAEEYSFPLKSVEEGMALRSHILACVETAAQTSDPVLRRQLLTFVVVGGGPTGVEFSGALAELLIYPLEKDFPELNLRREAQVVLLEASPELLQGIGGGDYAAERLKGLGISIELESAVERVDARGVVLESGDRIDAETVVWTAGVRGVSLAGESGLPLTRGGRVPVTPELNIAEDNRLFVIGDLAYFEQDGRPLPGVAQVAMQQGEQAAANILALAAGERPASFRYRDKGSMATIGRNAAVANLRGRLLTGFPAWLLWLGVHIFFLIGFRNRLGVLVNWAWNYIFYDRVVRLILPGRPRHELSSPAKPRTEHTNQVATR